MCPNLKRSLLEPPVRLGTVQVALGATMISFSAVFVKLARVGPTTAGFYRTLFGGLILAGVLWARRDRLSCGRRHFLLAAACSVFFALDLSFWHRSIHSVGPGLATLLSNFQVFFVGAFGIAILGERPTWRLGIAIPSALFGLYLLVGPEWGQLPATYKLGVSFGLITAVCYAGYILMLRKTTMESSNTLRTMMSVSFICAVLMGLEAGVQGESFMIADSATFFALLGYGIISQVLGWVLISSGLSKVAASRAGLVLLLQPTLAFVWDVLFFNRPIQAIEFLGATLALTAIYLGTTR